MLFNMILPGAVVTARLPAEYQEVEYIQSSGTQYIDTGVKPTANTKVLARVNVLSNPNRNAWLFGSRNANASSRYEVIWISGSSAYRFYYGTSNYTFSGVSSTGELTITTAASGATINGVSVTPAAATISSENTMYIFSCHGGTASNETSYMQLFSFQIYEGNTLVRDFVPCYRKADTVVGLYDLANGVFYSNIGTGTFAKGADVSGSVTPPATGDFAFTYSGNYTDNRVNGIGDVTLNTSGTLTVTGQTVKVKVYILAGGGGGCVDPVAYCGGGGGGGYQTIEVELVPGTYEIVIGTGGTALKGNGTAGNGGNTTAFGVTSTGGKGGYTGSTYGGGAGGTPNGVAGIRSATGDATGGSPNGGSVVDEVPQPGGNGLVRITFS
ncbi:MAG: hypothetical protein IKU32_02220 [Clostridia bacterium]|nr:hypothetical protein [Clostridia bacterium]